MTIERTQDITQQVILQIMEQYGYRVSLGVVSARSCYRIPIDTALTLSTAVPAIFFALCRSSVVEKLK